MLKAHTDEDPFRSLRTQFSDVLPEPDRARKFFTLIFLLDDKNDSVLLGVKARGFAVGKTNGFGGKFDSKLDSDIQASASRELEEECSLFIPAEKFAHDGVIFFQFDKTLQEKTFEVHIFSVRLSDAPKFKKNPDAILSESNEDKIENVIEASEEMNPVQFYKRTQVPLGKMWPDDAHWLPPFLKWKLVENRDPIKNKEKMLFSAAFTFSDYDTIVKHRILEFGNKE